jgi:hypothetical protein
VTTTEKDTTAVDINFPLPADLFGTIGRIFNLAYPGTMIDTTTSHLLRLHIPNAERYRDELTRQELLAEKQHVEDAHVAVIQSIEDGNLGIETPEYMSKLLVTCARDMFANNPNAENFLEMQVRDRETNARYVVTVARSERQTPAQLLRDAKAKLAAAEALARDWADQPTDYDEDTEQQIADGRELLKALEAN